MAGGQGMKMVRDARNAWRWFSVQLSVVGVAVSAGWLALPADLTSNVPAWAQNVVTGLIFAGVVAGRLIDQGGGDE